MLLPLRLNLQVILVPVTLPAGKGGGGGGELLRKRRLERNRILRIQREDEEIIVMAIQFIEIIEEDDEWDRLLAV